MLTKVRGPYLDKTKNFKHILIFLYNNNYELVNKTKISYSRYLKELELDLHQYEQYIPLTNYKKRLKHFNKVKDLYSLPLINKENKEQFYYPNAFEIKERPGYYYIPFEGSTYIINREGNIIDISDNNSKEWRSPEGYKVCNLITIDENKLNHVTARQHRLLALLFIPRPDRHLDKRYDDLDINHKDGIKDNNDIDNLEWVTSVENIDHAFINGLSTIAGISKPVLAKNIITNEIKYFYSIGSCAKVFQIDDSKLRKHLSSSNYGLISVDNYIFKFDNDVPWPNRHPIVNNNRGYFKTIRDIIVKNVITGNVIVYKSINDAIRQLGLTSGLFEHFKKYGKDVPYKNYMFYTLEEFKDNTIKR